LFLLIIQENALLSHWTQTFTSMRIEKQIRGLGNAYMDTFWQRDFEYHIDSIHITGIFAANFGLNDHGARKTPPRSEIQLRPRPDMDIALKYWTDVVNAGDLFSRDVADRYIGPVTARATGDPFGSINLMLIGSLMLWCDRDTVVCGSGMIAPEIKPTAMPRKIIAVRGPRTRAELLKLGAEVPERYGDAGLLAGDFATPGVAQTHDYGVILHHSEQSWYRNFGRGWLRKRDDTLYIDIRQDAVSVFDAIQRCGTIFSSSLHGLIFAHALGKRTTWVKCTELVGHTFKFHDYFNSIGVDESAMQPEQIAGAADMRKLGDRSRMIDVAPFLPMVRENLEETRAYFAAVAVQDAADRTRQTVTRGHLEAWRGA
jgi:pyruvyltransferase